MPDFSDFDAHLIKITSKKNLTMDAITAEIAWCEQNRGLSKKGAKWEEGFIAGLKQALLLADAIKKGKYKVTRGVINADS